MLYFFYNYIKAITSCFYNNTLRVSTYNNHWAKWYSNFKNKGIVNVDVILFRVTCLSIILLCFSIYHDLSIASYSVWYQVFDDIMYFFYSILYFLDDLLYELSILLVNLLKLVYHYLVTLGYLEYVITICCNYINLVFSTLYSKVASLLSCTTGKIILHYPVFGSLFFIDIEYCNLVIVKADTYMYFNFSSKNTYYRFKVGYMIVVYMLHNYSWVLILDYILFNLYYYYQIKKLGGYLLSVKFHGALFLSWLFW